MVDQLSGLCDYPGVLAPDIIFGEIYHTPASQMWFRLSGIANSDYINLSAWFQCVYSVHFYRNSDAGGAVDTMSVQISGTVPNNCGPVLIFHDPDLTEVYDFHVIGHKALAGTGFQ